MKVIRTVSVFLILSSVLIAGCVNGSRTYNNPGHNQMLYDASHSSSYKAHH